MRLLRLALSSQGKRPVALVQPPHVPTQRARARARVHRPVARATAADSRVKDCGCAMVGRVDIACRKLPRAALRLHLAAQSSETLFFMVRPLAAAQDTSPAVLRLAMRPERDGLTVGIAKRRGPARAEPLSIPLQPTPSSHRLMLKRFTVLGRPRQLRH